MVGAVCSTSYKICGGGKNGRLVGAGTARKMLAANCNYNNVWPRAHRPMAQAALTVSKIWASVWPKRGLVSTISIDDKRPVSATASATNKPSLKVSPPSTLVPVIFVNVVHGKCRDVIFT